MDEVSMHTCKIYNFDGEGGVMVVSFPRRDQKSEETRKKHRPALTAKRYDSGAQLRRLSRSAK